MVPYQPGTEALSIELTMVTGTVNEWEVLAMMTETARKTSLKNKHLRKCDYFAIIPSCSHFTMLTRNPATGLV